MVSVHRKWIQEISGENGFEAEPATSAASLFREAMPLTLEKEEGPLIDDAADGSPSTTQSPSTTLEPQAEAAASTEAASHSGKGGTENVDVLLGGLGQNAVTAPSHSTIITSSTAPPSLDHGNQVNLEAAASGASEATEAVTRPNLPLGVIDDLQQQQSHPQEIVPLSETNVTTSKGAEKEVPVTTIKGSKIKENGVENLLGKSRRHKFLRSNEP